MFIVLNYNFYNIIKIKKDIAEKVRLVVLHGLATIDGGREWRPGREILKLYNIVIL